ncbi:MAG: N-acetyltransferase [Lachnospiraceae bacterium]|nr:N-acetyltransferase [Lachnospiraceae bacterium]
MILRLETEKDYFENVNLTREAFWNVYRPGCDEHLLHRNIRSAASYIKDLCYVAEEDGKLVGNIVYAKMWKDGKMCDEVIGFGPLSVLPEKQKQGVGSALVTDTLKRAKEMGFKAVLITGNPDYYHRFGFSSATKFGVRLSDIAEGDEASFFMAVELEEGYLTEHAGVYDFDPVYVPDAKELEEFEKQFPIKKKREPRETDLG